jgi:AcrR family transcriptional regulator
MKHVSSMPESTSPRQTTRALLIEAAAAEFNESGFQNTDTNRIARRAGFAPQTFYRHFKDKTEVFIHVYERWQADERELVLGAIESLGSNRDAQQIRLAMAASILQSHTLWRIFRRSLRILALEDDRVRTARATSRRAQLDAVAALSNGPHSSWEDRVAALLTVERLCDAAAEGETDDLECDDDFWVRKIADALSGLVVLD